MPLRKSDYRDLDKYYATRRQQMRRYRQRTGAGLYSPRSWTKEEDHRVLEHTIPDRQLGKEIQRSVSAISVRRVKLKRKLREKQAAGGHDVDRI